MSSVMVCRLSWWMRRSRMDFARWRQNGGRVLGVGGYPSTPTRQLTLNTRHPVLQHPKPNNRHPLRVHRRDALWQVERVARPACELYEELHEQDGNSPLVPMTRPERMDADFRGTGLTIGRHPVAYRRAE